MQAPLHALRILSAYLSVPTMRRSSSPKSMVIALEGYQPRRAKFAHSQGETSALALALWGLPMGFRRLHPSVLQVE